MNIQTLLFTLFLFTSTLAFATAKDIPPVTSALDTTLVPPTPKFSSTSVKSLLAAIQSILKKIDVPGSQLMAHLQDGANPEEMSEKSIEEIHAIAAKLYPKSDHALEQFIVETQTLVSTYIALEPKAFEALLPSIDKPGIKEKLANPKLNEREKKLILNQIKYAQENKDPLYQQLIASVSENNKKALRPYLKEISALFKQTQTTTPSASPVHAH
jgi:hypothetical protein